MGSSNSVSNKGRDQNLESEIDGIDCFDNVDTTSCRSTSSAKQEEDLEDFVQLGIYHGNKSNAIKMFMQDEQAGLVFHKFLRKRNYDQYKIYLFLQNLIQGLDKESCTLSKGETSALIQRYAHTRKEISARMTVLYYYTKDIDVSVEEKAKQLKKLFRQAANTELMEMMADDIPEFLASQTYRQWRDAEAINGYSFVSLPLLQLIKSKPQDDKSMHDFVSNILLEKSNYTQEAFASLDPKEIKNFAQSHYLTTFLGAVEGLPISVSIAKVGLNRPDTPLVYVNKIFEQVTGYTRNEIVGKNASFLQRDQNNNEPDGVRALSQILASNEVKKFKARSFRKNGESFINLMAYKPLRDKNGVVSYIIGLHYDTSCICHESKNVLSRSLLDMDILLSILPNQLPAND